MPLCCERCLILSILESYYPILLPYLPSVLLPYQSILVSNSPIYSFRSPYPTVLSYLPISLSPPYLLSYYPISLSLYLPISPQSIILLPYLLSYPISLSPPNLLSYYPIYYLILSPYLPPTYYLIPPISLSILPIGAVRCCLCGAGASYRGGGGGGGDQGSRGGARYDIKPTPSM
ncbi:hypothetical protein B484DRAFT_123580 [Ochromonadaceae sp. CCMP2298]|nr:hypothetical protein B484DRAFT_123580 [Ochromonadaceae sp. CCMP2298]